MLLTLVDLALSVANPLRARSPSACRLCFLPSFNENKSATENRDLDSEKLTVANTVTNTSRDANFARALSERGLRPVKAALACANYTTIHFPLPRSNYAILSLRRSGKLGRILRPGTCRLAHYEHQCCFNYFAPFSILTSPSNTISAFARPSAVCIIPQPWPRLRLLPRRLPLLRAALLRLHRSLAHRTTRQRRLTSGAHVRGTCCYLTFPRT